MRFSQVFLLILVWTPKIEADIRIDHSLRIPENRTFTEERHSPVIDGGEEERGPYTKAVGKINGCSATIVSPPNAKVTAIALAAHCETGPTLTLSDGTKINGLECYRNKDWKRGNDFKSSENDVTVCFSAETVNTGFYGCLTPRQPIKTESRVRMLGFGHPRNADPAGPHGPIRYPQVKNLLSGIVKITGSTSPNKSLMAYDDKIKGARQIFEIFSFSA